MGKKKVGGHSSVNAAKTYRRQQKEAQQAKLARLNMTAEERLEAAKNHPNTKAMLRKKELERMEASTAAAEKLYDPIENAEEVEFTETFS